MSSLKKILVLGGGGFIGRNIVKYLVERGDCHVMAADIIEGSNWKGLFNSNPDRFNFLLGDFTKLDTFELFKNSFDEIYMLAAVVGVNRTIKNPADVIKTNTKLTTNVLDWVEKNTIKKLLF